MAPGEPLPQAARDALARGEKIEAIKLLRESAGVDLKTAKEWVERAERGETAAPVSDVLARPASRGMPAASVAALQRGDRIGAIRALREASRMGLKEAKEAVEAHLAAHPALAAQLAAASGARLRANLPWIVALAAILAGIVISMLLDGAAS